MSTSFILKHLDERRASMAKHAIASLEAGVAAGEIRNALYLDAKDTVNRAMEEAAEAFLATGPHEQHPKHPQSDWWLAAYDADAFLHGAHYLPAALKRARASKLPLKEYADFLAALLPLAELLAAAKPLIVKRQVGVQAPKTPAQLEREAATMTCQCCARKYLANLGTIAHHGYERPGHGWQTASCMGAKHLPFEVDRKRLGQMIVGLRGFRARCRKARISIAKERVPIVRTYQNSFARDAEKFEFGFTRANYASEEAKLVRQKASIHIYSFDDLLKAELRRRDLEIKAITHDIDVSQKRFDEWVQTAEWNAAEKSWRILRVK